MKYSIIIHLLVWAICLCIFYGCTDDKKEPNLDITTIVSERTLVITEQETRAMTEILEDRIVFNQDVDASVYEQGRVLVSGITDIAPSGFLRKVTGHHFEDGQVVVMCETASLEDAFDQLGLEIRHQLDPGKLAQTRIFGEGVTFYTDKPLCTPILTPLYAKQRDSDAVDLGQSITFRHGIDKKIRLERGVQMHIHGNLDLEVGFELLGKITLLDKLCYLKSGMEVVSKNNLSVTVDGACDYEDEFTICEHRFTPISMVVAGVPIVLDPQFFITLKVSAHGESETSSSVSINASYSTGLVYDKPQWSTYNKKKIDYEYKPPDFYGYISASAAVAPRFELNLYGMAGPYVTGTGKLEMEARAIKTLDWTLAGGFSVDAGIHAELLGFGASKEISGIIKDQKELAKGSEKAFEGPKMVYIDGGSFVFSSGTDPTGQNRWCIPPTRVNVSPFYLGQYEVTLGEYWEYVRDSGYNGNRSQSIPKLYHPDPNHDYSHSEQVPNAFTRPDQNYQNYAANLISWYDAISFCNWKSKKEGFEPVYSISLGPILPRGGYELEVIPDWSANGYRLPTEAEWTWAACEGTKHTSFIFSGSNMPRKVAYYMDNSDWSVRPVGKLEPNALGLYDMSGNVHEWCWDGATQYYQPEEGSYDPKGAYTNDERVFKGGSWCDKEEQLKIKSRISASPETAHFNFGFRLCRSAR